MNKYFERLIFRFSTFIDFLAAYHETVKIVPQMVKTELFTSYARGIWVYMVIVLIVGMKFVDF